LHYIKDWFLGIKHSAKGAIAPTIVAALIFFVTYRFFGVENSMIAPFATLSYLRFTRLNHNLDCMFKHVMIYIVMAVLAYVACINLPLCIIVNALGLFWIAYILIDEYQPNNYFASGMALMFFQLAPTEGFSGLGMRIGALAVSFVIIFLFVTIPMLLGLGKKKETLSEMIARGFVNCRKQLAMAESDPAAGILTGFSYGVMQFLIGPYIYTPIQVLVDYPLAFGALGLAGFFHKAKHGLVKGYVAGILGRYVFAVISGWIFFGEYAWEGWNPFAYSLAYNGAYIFAEAAVTVAILLVPAVAKSLGAIKVMANEEG